MSQKRKRDRSTWALFKLPTDLLETCLCSFLTIQDMRHLLQVSYLTWMEMKACCLPAQDSTVNVSLQKIQTRSATSWFLRQEMQQLQQTLLSSEICRPIQTGTLRHFMYFHTLSYQQHNDLICVQNQTTPPFWSVFTPRHLLRKQAYVPDEQGTAYVLSNPLVMSALTAGGAIFCSAYPKEQSRLTVGPSSLIEWMREQGYLALSASSEYLPLFDMHTAPREVNAARIATLCLKSTQALQEEYQRLGPPKPFEQYMWYDLHVTRDQSRHIICPMRPAVVFLLLRLKCIVQKLSYSLLQQIYLDARLSSTPDAYYLFQRLCQVTSFSPTTTSFEVCLFEYPVVVIDSFWLLQAIHDG